MSQHQSEQFSTSSVSTQDPSVFRSNPVSLAIQAKSKANGPNWIGRNRRRIAALGTIVGIIATLVGGAVSSHKFASSWLRESEQSRQDRITAAEDGLSKGINEFANLSEIVELNEKKGERYLIEEPYKKYAAAVRLEVLAAKHPDRELEYVEETREALKSEVQVVDTWTNQFDSDLRDNLFPPSVSDAILRFARFIRTHPTIEKQLAQLPRAKAESSVASLISLTAAPQNADQAAIDIRDARTLLQHARGFLDRLKHRPSLLQGSHTDLAQRNLERLDEVQMMLDNGDVSLAPSLKLVNTYFEAVNSLDKAERNWQVLKSRLSAYDVLVGQILNKQLVSRVKLDAAYNDIAAASETCAALKIESLGRNSEALHRYARNKIDLGISR